MPAPAKIVRSRGGRFSALRSPARQGALDMAGHIRNYDVNRKITKVVAR